METDQNIKKKTFASEIDAAHKYGTGWRYIYF